MYYDITMSDSQSRKGKKRSKSYYKKCGQKKMRRNSNLEVGMKGFLVTCNHSEKQAVRECYNILNEYADKLYGPEENQNKESDDELGDSEEDDMEKAMQKEVQELALLRQQTERRFQNCYTKAKNCIFIKTTLSDPCELAHTILTDIASSKIQKTRFALRMIPVLETCRALTGDIEKLATKIFEDYFRTPFGKGLNYSTLIKVRNNNSLGRDSVLPMLGSLVKGMNPLHKVSYDNPDFVILVEVLGNICCLSVVKDFYNLKKFNLIEVAKSLPAGDVTAALDPEKEAANQAAGGEAVKVDSSKLESGLESETTGTNSEQQHSASDHHGDEKVEETGTDCPASHDVQICTSGCENPVSGNTAVGPSEGNSLKEEKDQTDVEEAEIESNLT